MQVAPLPLDERKRLHALQSLQLREEPEERFDRVTRLAAEIFQVPMAFVSFVEHDRQWFKSKVGLCASETSRDISFCAHAILGDEALVVPDTHQDARFADNPFVTGDPFLRFYMGQPLRAPGGEKIGTLCIADHRPHELSAEHARVLPGLAALIEQELQMGDLIEAQAELLTTQEELLATQRRLQAELSEAARYVRSLIPPPLQSPVAIDWRYLPSAELGGDSLGYQFLSASRIAVYVLDICGHGVGAALLSVVLLDVLHSRSLANVDFGNPAAVLSALNREFPIERHGRFFTMWYGVADLEGMQLTFSTAGHPPGVLVGGGGEVRSLSTSGIPVGCIAEARYENEHSPLIRGDVLYLYTDGAYELGAGRTALSLPALAELFAHSGKAESSLDFIVSALERANGAPSFPDDISIVEIRIPPVAEGG